MLVEREIIAYSLLSALQKQGHDSIEIFCPFVVRAIPPDAFIDIVEVQQRVCEIFNISKQIPIFALNTILKKAKNKKYIETTSVTQEDGDQKTVKTSTFYKSTPLGFEYTNKLAEKEVSPIRDQIETLCKNIQRYFNIQKNTKITRDEIYDMLISFIRKNLTTLESIVNQSISTEFNILPVSHKNERLLIDYLRFIYERRDKDYKIFSEMLYGSIMSLLLCSEKDNIADVKDRKIRPCKVYLDTNFVFSVLDLHMPEQSKSAQELFDLLKDNKFELRIFDFTIGEICSVLGRYVTFMQSGQGKLLLDNSGGFGLYRKIYKEQWSGEELRKFISEIRFTLQQKGITIETISKDGIEQYLSDYSYIESLLRKEKPKQLKGGREHDLLAISAIKEKRGKKHIFRLEDAKAIFLTSDRVLSKLNYENMDHKKEGTVSEVILDSLLANLLWIKNPNLEFPLETIIAANARTLFIKEDVWDVFWERVKLLYAEGRINENDIAMLFYDRYIEDALSQIDEDDLEKMSDDTIFKHIEVAKKRVENEIQVLKAKDQEIIGVLEEKAEEICNLLREKEKDFKFTLGSALLLFNQQKDVSSELLSKTKAEKYVSNCAMGISLCLFLFVVSIGIIPHISFKWLIILCMFFSEVIIVLSWKFDLWPWTKLKNYKYSMYRESSLSETEEEKELLNSINRILCDGGTNSTGTKKQ
jgi:hypothetical protein